MKKRKMILSVLGLICSLMIAACTVENTEPAADLTSEKNSETVFAEESQKPESESQEPAEAAEESVDVSLEPQQDHSLYESFLRNETTVQIDTGKYYQYCFDKLGIQKQDYTLEELENIFSEYMLKSIGESGKEKVTAETEYAYIDCGKDGKDELAVWVDMEPSAAEGWDPFFIVRENDGALQVVFADYESIFQHIYLNEYGYIIEGSSAGEGSGGAKNSFIDAEGKWHFLYSTHIDSITHEEYIGYTVPEEIALDGNYSLTSFDFENTWESDNYLYTITARSDQKAEGELPDWLHGYLLTELAGDDTLYADANPLKQFFEKEEQYHITPFGEIEQMVSDREKAEGLSEELKECKAAKRQALK